MAKHLALTKTWTQRKDGIQAPQLKAELELDTALDPDGRLLSSDSTSSWPVEHETVSRAVASMHVSFPCKAAPDSLPGKYHQTLTLLNQAQ